jgi:hypothetical protein
MKHNDITKRRKGGKERMKKLIWIGVIPVILLTWSVTFAPPVNDPPFPPEIVVYPNTNNCTDAGVDLITYHYGPVPADPNGDPVTLQYHWYRDANGSGQYEEFLNLLETWLPGEMTQVGERWQVEALAVDGLGLEGQPTIRDYNVITEECLDDYDMGDIDYCYPTNVLNPAHKLTGIAWLGTSISAEDYPHTFPYGTYNSDTFDDGVIFSDPAGATGTPFVGLPWLPCHPETLRVIVHACSLYTHQPMWLNAWKDGNLDCDFDDGPNTPAYVPPEIDYLCTSEWIIQDAIVFAPGPNLDAIYTYVIMDPGVWTMGVYDLHLRFRLSYTPLGRYGYGMGGPNGYGTFDVDEYLGEVEDYDIRDGQLPVELTSFRATPGDASVTLNWTTASETNNDYFYLLRSASGGQPMQIGTIDAAQNGATGASYEFVDSRVTNGVTYKYVLVDVDINGRPETHYSMEVTATPSFTASSITPGEYALHQNYPNPFNASTTIVYDVSEPGHVSLAIFDVLGRQVKVLVDGEQSAGRYPVSLDASSLSSGIYFCRLQVNGYSDMKKMVVLK